MAHNELKVQFSLAALPLHIYVEGSGITRIINLCRKACNIHTVPHVTKQPRRQGKLVAQKLLCIRCGVDLTEKVGISARDETSWLFSFV